MIQYIKNERHYELLLDRISKVKHTLWIGTADLKDLYIKKQDAAIPFLALLDQKIKKGVAIRLLHAKEPGENFRKDFDLYPSLWNGMERALVQGYISRCWFSIWKPYILVLPILQVLHSG